MPDPGIASSWPPSADGAGLSGVEGNHGWGSHVSGAGRTQPGRNDGQFAGGLGGCRSG